MAASHNATFYKPNDDTMVALVISLVSTLANGYWLTRFSSISGGILYQITQII
jgi:hypothetical protein